MAASILTAAVPTATAGTARDAAGVPAHAGRATRSRLAHVDAMRPVKQLGVVSTHSFLLLAPATLWIGAGITLLHVSREAFLFVSACMLTYGYADLRRSGLARFWRRRLIAVGLPYLCWTLIYFAVGLRHGGRGPTGDLLHLGYLLLTGYSQLYFLVVLVEFYLLFPLVAWLLRATKGHHGALVVVSALVQVVYLSAMHWAWLPSELRGTHGTRFFFSYEFYLLAGCVAAVHYERFHAFLVRHWRKIVLGTVLSGLCAEATYWLTVEHVAGVFGRAGDAFSPYMLPFNVFAIALIYLIGVALVRPRRSPRARRLVQIGVDDSYAIYLSQVLVLQALIALGFRQLNGKLPWPVVLALGIAVVYVAGCAVGEVVARTPLARAVAGRSRARRTADSSQERSRPLIERAASPRNRTVT